MKYSGDAKLFLYKRAGAIAALDESIAEHAKAWEDCYDEIWQKEPKENQDRLDEFCQQAQEKAPTLTSSQIHRAASTEYPSIIK